MSIKKEYSDCAVTLSVGEKERESYQRFFDAGADRYLLRHETVCEEHYGTLHPPSMSYAHRQECLRNLKNIGFQTGCGFMVGTPGQTPENLADELMFLKDFQPAMVGIGPFIPHRDTPFGNKAPGSAELTLYLLGLIGCCFPKSCFPPQLLWAPLLRRRTGAGDTGRGQCGHAEFIGFPGTGKIRTVRP